MTFSIKEIRSKFDKRFIWVSHLDWVVSEDRHLGRLYKDSYTGRIYFRTIIQPSNPSYKELIAYRMKFLSKFRYTQQLSCFNRYCNTLCYIVELHGFRKDM